MGSQTYAVTRGPAVLGIDDVDAIPFVLRFIEHVDWEPGMAIHGYDTDPSASDEKTWTHYDDSTGVLSTESDTTTD